MNTCRRPCAARRTAPCERSLSPNRRAAAPSARPNASPSRRSARAGGVPSPGPAPAQICLTRRQWRPVDVQDQARRHADSRPGATQGSESSGRRYRSANRRESGTGARLAGTTGRSPSAARVDVSTLQRQHVADGAAQALLEHTRQSVRSSSSFSFDFSGSTLAGSRRSFHR